MRSPSIVPATAGDATYIVLDDLGDLGTAYREPDPARPDRSALVRDLLDGQYNHPIKIVAFNTVEGWSRDASVDIADSVIDLAQLEFARLPDGTRQFVEHVLGEVPAWPVA